MENLGKVYKYNYFAEIMSDIYGSMTNKHRIPEKKESSSCARGAIPLSLQLQSWFFWVFF